MNVSEVGLDDPDIAQHSLSDHQRGSVASKPLVARHLVNVPNAIRIEVDDSDCSRDIDVSPLNLETPNWQEVSSKNPLYLFEHPSLAKSLKRHEGSHW